MGLFDAGRTLQMETGYDDVLDYIRDGLVVSRHVPCKLGQTAFEYQDYEAVSMRVFRMDFIVEADSINVNFPEPGDIIECKGRRFAVQSPNGEPCWRWRGPSMTSWRIHAEEVSSGTSDD